MATWFDYKKIKQAKKRRQKTKEATLRAARFYVSVCLYLSASFGSRAYTDTNNTYTHNTQHTHRRGRNPLNRDR